MITKNLKNLLTTIDYLIVMFFGLVFFYKLINNLNMSISISEGFDIFSKIMIKSISLILISFLISILTKENVFTSIKPLKLNNVFRIMVIIQFGWNLIFLFDWINHPNLYISIPIHVLILINSPTILWILRTYFYRLVAIEKHIIANENKINNSGK